MEASITTQDFIQDVKDSCITFSKQFLLDFFQSMYSSYNKRYELWKDLGLRIEDRGDKGKRCSEIHKIYSGKPIRMTLLLKMLRLTDYNKSDVISEVKLIGHFRTHNDKMLNLPFVFKIDYNLGMILGHLFGDGHISKTSDLISYNNSDMQLVKNFKENFRALFDHDLTICKNSSDMYSCSLRSKNYYWLIKKIIYKVNKIDKLPNDFEIGFFSALFDDEGSFTVTDKRAHIHFGMRNKILVSKAHNWLKRNNIMPSNIYVDRKFRKSVFYYFYVSKKQFKFLDKVIDIKSKPKIERFHRAMGVVS